MHISSNRDEDQAALLARQKCEQLIAQGVPVTRPIGSLIQKKEKKVKKQRKKKKKGIPKVVEPEQPEKPPEMKVSHFRNEWGYLKPRHCIPYTVG